VALELLPRRFESSTRTDQINAFFLVAEYSNQFTWVTLASLSYYVTPEDKSIQLEGCKVLSKDEADK
jgi:hypothetical protein